MDHYESSLFQTIATYLLEVYSRSLQESYFNCWTWTPETCIFFDCKFLKKSLFGVAYKAREHVILNHKNGKICTFLVIPLQRSFVDAAVAYLCYNVRTLGLVTHLVSVCEYVEFNKTLKLRWKLSDES